MKVIPGNAQAVGTRQEQQDAFGFTDIDDATFVAHGGVLAVVADGMGGMVMGRQASQRAVDALLQAYAEKGSDEPIPEALRRSLQAANAAVVQLAAAANVAGDVGTTSVAAVIHQGQLYWTSVGDSRLYLYRQGNLTQLTTDHAFATELAKAVQEGVISQEEAERHPERRSLTSYLGQSSLAKVDCNDTPFILQRGDRILLCSDGLYGTLESGEMSAVLRADPQPAAEALINAALKRPRSHQDNITAVVMGWEDEENARRPTQTLFGLDRGQLHRYAIVVLAVLLVGMIGLFVERYAREEGQHDQAHTVRDASPSQPAEGDAVRKEGVTP
jgi:PPM family protein phosphatase